MIYRYPRGGRIAGVCAGLARYFDVAPFAVRAATIASFFFIGPFIIAAYVIAALALPTIDDDGRSPPERPWNRDQARREAGRAYHEAKREAKRAWKSARRGGAASETAEPSNAAQGAASSVEEVRERMRMLDRRIAAMEAHIAEREFDLAKAIDDLERS